MKGLGLKTVLKKEPSFRERKGSVDINKSYRGTEMRLVTDDKSEGGNQRRINFEEMKGEETDSFKSDDIDEYDSININLPNESGTGKDKHFATKHATTFYDRK